jgi:mRNA interferase MazF
MPFEPGEILLLAFPFSSGTVVKQRPALVLLDTGDLDILVARVTTQSHDSPYDVLLQDWSSAGLVAPSTARLHKVATLEKSRVQRKLGRLSSRDRIAVRAVFEKILNPHKWGSIETS